MRNLFLFFWRNYFFFLFLILEVISFLLIYANNNFQSASIFNSSNVIASSVMKSANNVSQYFSLKSVNQELADENTKLRNQILNNYIKIDNSTFKKNDTIYKQKYVYLNAKVINNTVNKRNNYITLDKGLDHGIRKDMAVVSPQGIVGIVKFASSNFCTVMSLLHKDTKISGKIKNNGQIGSIEWEGGDYHKCVFKDIPTHVKLNNGDTIITSGYSTIFPEGIMIGTINEFEIKEGDNFYTISVALSTDFNSISHVYIIKNLMKYEQEYIESVSQND